MVLSASLPAAGEHPAVCVLFCTDVGQIRAPEGGSPGFLEDIQSLSTYRKDTHRTAALSGISLPHQDAKPPSLQVLVL